MNYYLLHKCFYERYSLNAKQAFAYLQRFKGLAFLEECYEAERL